MLWQTQLSFGLFVLLTLGITFWAARRSAAASQFYAAGGSIGARKNGLAIAGDFMSAGTLLGTSGFVFFYGFDGYIFAVGAVIGWPIVLFLISERLRNLGRYTFTDVVSARFAKVPVRVASAASALSVTFLYLMAQMIGAGALIEVVFGLPYEIGVSMVGVLMVVYVAMGGMLATTWVQLIKAFLMLGGGTMLFILVMAPYGFNFNTMFETAVTVSPQGEGLLRPGELLPDTISAIGFAIGGILGVAGLPHVLMRFFTVSDANEARRSAVWATGFIGYFQVVIFLTAMAGIGILTDISVPADLQGKGGQNSVLLHLSHALGGPWFLGFMSAIAFSTILAVVAGLTLAAAAAVSHDLYAGVLRRGQVSEEQEVKVSRISALVIGAFAVVLSWAVKDQNVSFIAALAFGIAASANAPVLIASMFWRGLTTRGALFGTWSGLLSALVLTIMSPRVWVDILGLSDPLIPWIYTTLFSVAISCVMLYVFSVTDQSERGKRERVEFGAIWLAALLGSARLKGQKSEALSGH